MARTRRIKTDGDAHYHLMSRTNDRRFLFEKGVVKSELVATLHRTAEFCGIQLNAYAVMSNHFHVVANVTKPDEPVGTEELLRRFGVLKGAEARERLAAHWEKLEAVGFDAALQEEQNRLRARMHDVSQFVKLFKEEFDRIYKRGRKYCGSIWSGRFTSTLIEDGEYFERCKRYVVYNPVRAGIVTQAKDYRWSWCEKSEKDESSEGPVPTKDETGKGFVPTGEGSAKWCLRRVAQIGAGKVFGSSAFVMRMAFELGDCFRAGVGPHPVGEIGYSTHGWKLATEAA